VSASERRIGPSKRCALHRFSSDATAEAALQPPRPTTSKEAAPVAFSWRSRSCRSPCQSSIGLQLVGLRCSPHAVSRFRCGSRVFPTEACPCVSVKTSASSPSLRVRRARWERDHPTSMTRANACQRTSHGPVFLGLDPSKSPSPASRGGPLQERPKTFHRAVAANPRHRVPPSWFLTTSTVFSAPRGPGLLHPGTGHGVRCVSRPPSDGCVKHPRRAAGQPPSRRRGNRPGSSQRNNPSKV